jgi:hypothetical protein
VKLRGYLRLKEFFFFLRRFLFRREVVLDLLNRYSIDLGPISFGELKKGCTGNLGYNRVV